MSKSNLLSESKQPANHQQQQQQASSSDSHLLRGGPVGALPSALSPSSWARATVPLHPLLPYGPGDFANSGRFLVPTIPPPSVHASAGRFSDPLSLRGTPLFLKLAIVLHVGLWLVRDSSLTSFVLFSALLTASLYFVVVRGEPFSLAFLAESDTAHTNASSPKATPNMAAHVNGGQPNMMQAHAQAALQPSGSFGSSSPPQFVSGNNVAQQSPSAAFAFHQPASASSSSSSSASALPNVTLGAPTIDATSPTPIGAPVFHESESTRQAHTSRAHSPAAIAAPTIEPSNMPQTPSVEPTMTPMVMAPVEDALSSSSSVLTTVAVPSELTPVVVAGATARHSSTDAEMSWSRASGASYDVRIGPNYKKYGKKAQSKGAIFECVGVDVFAAPDGKLEHVAEHLQLPWIAKGRPGSEDGDPWVTTAAAPAKPHEDPKPPHEMDPVEKASDAYEVDPRVLAIDDEIGVPTMFIVNFQIPTYAPGYFSSKEDGEGFSILLYYQITAATRQEIRSGKLSPAVQLFKDFVNNAHAFEYHSRFKAIPRIVNPAEAKVGMATRQAMKMYNSKPFLTGPHCHSFIRGPGYMEADIDVHRFCLSARKGAYGTLDALSSLICDIGFVIEAGREGNDDELPEMILACGRIAHLDPMNAKSLGYYEEIGKKRRAERHRQ